MGSLGLDAGCGIGLDACCLAEAIGSLGRVVCLDVSPDNISVVRKLALKGKHWGQIELVKGNVLRLPFKDRSFDWSWCCDTMWPLMVADNPVEAVSELARVVRVGGVVAVLYWSSQCLLSGYPVLEARLNSAFTATVPYLNRVPPSLHFLRAAGWFRAAGLEQVVARSYIADWQAPLSDDTREAIAYCFEMFWGGLDTCVSRDDWAMYRRLCSPASKEFVPLSPDYYGFLTYTLFCGHVMQ